MKVLMYWVNRMAAHCMGVLSMMSRRKGSRGCPALSAMGRARRYSPIRRTHTGSLMGTEYPRLFWSVLAQRRWMSTLLRRTCPVGAGAGPIGDRGRPLRVAWSADAGTGVGESCMWKRTWLMDRMASILCVGPALRYSEGRRPPPILWPYRRGRGYRGTWVPWWRRPSSRGIFGRR